MLSLSEHQARWRAALLSPDEGFAASLHPALPIHRNNFFHATGSALAAQFPTVEALVGAEFFVAMARDFILATPPVSPVIMSYGADFPAFVRAYAPAQDLPYLSDVADLEWKLNQVRDAADVPPLEPQSFAVLAPEDLLALRLALVPAGRLFLSDYAAVRIWRAHHDDPAELSGIGPIDDPCRALIVRQGRETAVIDLTRGEAVLVEALEAGEELGAAMTQALEEDSEHDVPASIRKLASSSALRLRDS